MRSFEEINNYFKSLEIKCYWSTESLSLEQLNTIVNTFEYLRIKYPKIVIDEIGDYYSIDKFHNKNAIEMSFNTLNAIMSGREEYFNNRLTEKQKAIDNLLVAIKKYENIKIDVNDEKYISAEFVATYQANERQIRINHKYTDNLVQNIYHEFGHAIGYQYRVNDDDIINELFTEIDKEEIKKYISEYALTNVKEFIAETFSKYETGYVNYIIKIVMAVIKEKIESIDPKSETDWFIDDFKSYKTPN
jgi:hypothetical protein